MMAGPALRLDPPDTYAIRLRPDRPGRRPRFDREIDRSAKGKESPAPSGEAGPTEWRTTPLWGAASSAPYLHDGRAATLHDAIALHGGEAELTSRRYAALAPLDRQAVLDFLRSQVAPSQPGRPVDRAARGKRK